MARQNLVGIPATVRGCVGISHPDVENRCGTTLPEPVHGDVTAELWSHLREAALTRSGVPTSMDCVPLGRHVVVAEQHKSCKSVP